MFRRSNRWHSRFDQPDPYDGSYDFSNPQSLNRYAYVQNDPVNFVDPSGLLMAAFIVCRDDYCGMSWGFIAGFGEGAPGVGFGGGDYWEGGNGLGPNQQNPAIQDAITPNDCYALVSQVRKIARDTNVYLAGGNGGSDIVQKFMDRLATTFTEFVDASSLGQSMGLVGIENSSADANRNRFSDVGFKEEFQDHVGPGFSDNQVRHTIGGLVAGYVGVPVLFMDRREDMGTPSGQADTPLNRVTMPMGEKLKSSGGSAALGLADWIKRTLCDPLRR